MYISERLKLVLEDILVSGRLDMDSVNSLPEEEKELVITLYHEGLVEEALNLLNDMDLPREWDRLRKKMGVDKQPTVPLWKTAMKFAAIFIGLFTIGYFIWTNDKDVEGMEISETSIKLKMGEDAIKVINEGESQQIVSASGKVIGAQNGNKIQYNSDADIDELIYNELEIPYGKIFNVELSDGTLVHLNSGTKMRYPIKFLKGQKREVFIDGEAYFKVAKDKDHPFIVNADAVTVAVLGTEFNISSYPEDSEIGTVLVAGSVSLSNSNVPNDVIVLKPGDKGTWDKNAHSIQTEKVDVSNYTGWVDGELVFRNSSFENMSKKLERRYNVTIHNNNLLLANKMFTAHFNVDIEGIDDVLRSIKEIHPFSYSIIDGKIEID